MSKISTVVDSFVSLVGSIEGLNVSFDPTNADGTPNQTAQDDAVNALIDTLVAQKLLSFPIPTTDVQIKAVALSLLHVLQAYKKATGKTSL